MELLFVILPDYNTIRDSLVHPFSKSVLLPTSPPSKIGVTFFIPPRGTVHLKAIGSHLLFEVFSSNIDLMNQILHVDDAVFAKRTHYQEVIRQGN